MGLWRSVRKLISHSEVASDDPKLSGPKKQDGWLAGPFQWRQFCLVISVDDLWMSFCHEREDGMLYIAPLPAVIFGIRLMKKN